MKRLILLAVLLLLIAFVSSSRVNKNNDPHKKHNDENPSFVSREKRNMHRDRAYQRANMLTRNAATRRRRNKADDHAIRAEADALAAAAESVAAGDNAANAAIEIEEQRKTMDHGMDDSKNEHDSDPGQSGSKNEQDSDPGQGGSMEEGQGQGGSKDEHESYGNNEGDQQEQQDNDEQSNEIVEESIHEKTKSSHKHTSSGDDSQSQSKDSEESSETSISKAGENGEAMNKLMSQSSELAQQIRMVFDIMSKREKYLVDEMKKLQTSLTDAIKVLKSDASSSSVESSDDGTVSRKRREFNSEEPYRACVYIESAVDVKGHGHHRVKRNIGEQNPANQENVQIRPEALKKQSGYPDPSENLVEGHSNNLMEGHQKNAPGQGPKREGIDLSTTYWFKLPEEQNLESVHDKIQKILSGISATDRDVLIIPVTKSFTSKQQVASAFLNVFRTRRSTTRQKREVLANTPSGSQL